MKNIIFLVNWTKSNTLIKNYYPFFVIFFLVCLFFYKTIISGLIPIPADLLVGAYYPWLDYKWGFVVGVPVKNPLISDIFSQLYPWRVAAMEAIRNGQWPLWNPYSLSGTPLAANLQSAAFYPLNLFMLLFGNIWGWTLLIVFQPLLSLSFTYLYLREIRLSKIASVFGAIVFSFSAFMMVWLEFGTMTQAGVWLPLLLLLIEKYLRQQKLISYILIPFTIFAVITAGSFQVAFYTLLVSFVYFLLKLKSLKFNKFTFVFGTLSFVLGIGFSAIQLFPSFELLNLSIRLSDNYIAASNYGLLPMQNLLTFFAPDIFGNPVTANYFGIHNYQETAGYFGVLTLPFIVLAALKSKRKLTYFFVAVFTLSLIFVFDNPLSRLIYLLKFPILSTSYASRLLFLTSFSAAILSAIGLDLLKHNLRLSIKSTIFILSGFLGFGISALLIYLYLKHYPYAPYISSNIENIRVMIRNMIFPAGLTILFILVGTFIKNARLVLIVIILITILDLFRFGLKYNPFVSSKLIFPETPALEYLQQNTGFARIERERTEVLTPNTWTAYSLMTPSGYDPLYTAQYARFYQVYKGEDPQGNSSRYAELNNYDVPILDLAGVKYLMAAKRDKQGVIKEDGTNLSYKIPLQKYSQVFTDKTIVVLENKTALPRVINFSDYVYEPDWKKAQNLLSEKFDFRNRIILNKNLGKNLDTASGDLVIKSYKSNEVIIESNLNKENIVMLSDTFYVGWKAKINGHQEEVLLADGIYRAVIVPAGKAEIKFYYDPDSFKYGSLITLISLVILPFACFVLRRKIKTK